ncbi:MAG TPA: hypothetical protein VNP95_11735, partial [Thermomicrobiales bacterium]|nr:hypothetical protein [Thermomicrobiales bacterium]
MGAWRQPHARLGAAVALLAGIILIVAALAAGPGVAAQGTPPPAATSCVVAKEPNDQVADAVDLGSGAVCATAANATGGQDVYRWTVAPDDAASTWSISTTDIAGQASQLEVYAVQLDASGAVTAATKLVSVPGGTGAGAGLRDLIWQPGTYYVGVASSGPGPYTLTIAKGTPLPAQNDPQGHDTAQTAIPVTGDFALSGDRSGADDFYAWTLDADQATHHWAIDLQGAVGTTAYLEIASPDGAVITSGRASAD